MSATKTDNMSTKNNAWQEIKDLWSQFTLRGPAMGRWTKPEIVCGDEPTKEAIVAIFDAVNQAVGVAYDCLQRCEQIATNNSATPFGRASIGFAIAVREASGARVAVEAVVSARQQLLEAWQRLTNITN